MTTTDTKPWEAAPLPRAVYGCADAGCAEEISYPPEMLYWVDAGWYCENCLSYYESPTPPTSLQDELERRQNE